MVQLPPRTSPQRWQQLEAALCAARFASEVALAHASSDSSLTDQLTTLLARVLRDPPPPSPEQGGRVLQAARFRVCGSLADFIADCGSAELLHDTVASAATALAQPGGGVGVGCAGYALVHVMRAADGRCEASCGGGV